MGERVDSNVFSPANAPWQQWELFGACFAALRINALCITRPSREAYLTEIFNGAITKLNKDFLVLLRPMRVVMADHKLDESLPTSIHFGDVGMTADWVQDGLVVLNGDNGEGIDIFYTLELKGDKGKHVLVVDQR